MLSIILLAAVSGGVEWVPNDYAGALAKARAAGKPMVVDLWAKWCHTCLSMKQEVILRERLGEDADRFVWASLDTDRPENAPALKKLGIGAWPTFYVVDPTDESVRARWVGSASLREFKGFLAEGRAKAGKATPHVLLARKGDVAAAAKDFPKAQAHYTEALAKAPKGWARAAGLHTSILGALYKQQKYAECARYGLANMDAAAAGRSATGLDAAWYAHYCGGKSGDAALAKRVREHAIRASSPQLATLDDPKAPLSTDDRSDGLRILREIHDELGKKEAARALAERQRKVLDAACAKAAPQVVMTFNWPRAEVYTYLGQGAELLDALKANAKALPKEYDPPYRLAWVLNKLGKHADALAAAKAAEALVYGPRKGRVLGLVAGLHDALKQPAKAKAAREAALKLYEGLPEGQRSEKAIAAARKALSPKK